MLAVPSLRSYRVPVIRGEPSKILNVGTFLCHLLRGESAQFVVNQRQQLISSPGIALLDPLQDLRKVAHWHRVTDRRPATIRKQTGHLILCD